ncbi:MAG: hypothetical protein DRQ78_11945 [Epsilonproteobacteria bacterium]|nr:MAG: hypothetical protein DRQ78_11945 [Campylobacterota bacterium]
MNRKKIPQNIDWKFLIVKFKRKVGSQRIVADVCGIGQTCISVISRTDSRKPNYETGAAIINAYLDYYDEVPLIKQKPEKGEL